jgi:hypothetical protein
MGGQRRARNTRQNFTPGDDTNSVASHVAPNALFDLGAVNRQQLARGGRARVYDSVATRRRSPPSWAAVRRPFAAQTVTDTLAIASVLSGRGPATGSTTAATRTADRAGDGHATTAEGTSGCRALSGQLSSA